MGLDDRTTTRRDFILAGTALSSGLWPPPGANAEGPATFELRASRFRGAPDGLPREVWGYNRRFPGPPIRAKEGEALRVRVVNDLAVPTSIHWHGIHQHGTPTMDGVEGVSRPPIPPGSEFVYEFLAEPAGTHWYHSHVGVQYGNGLLGPLVVDEKAPIARHDREEVLLFGDWFRELGDTLLARLTRADAMGGMPDMPEMPAKKAMPAMKGGMAMKDVGDLPFESGHVNGKGRAPGASGSPLHAVEAGRGETLRLRLINGSSTFAFRFGIDGHPLTVIATDGSPMKPVEVDSLYLGTGERYDVLLRAEGGPPRWIRAVTLDGNEVRAVLRDKGSGTGEPPPSMVRWGPRTLAPAAMRSPGPVTLEAKPREVPIVLGGSMSPYRWSIGGQVYPKADPIVVSRGESIRFLFRNPTGMDHPFHLHGHSFHVLGRPGALNLTDPVLKDTVNVTAGGELAVQWVADNPGRWFFHCHIEWHMATGMARVVEVRPS